MSREIVTFAIYRISTGELVSHETDTASQRLTDPDLLAAGLARKAVPAQLQPNQTWDKSTLAQVTRAVSADEVSRAALVAKGGLAWSATEAAAAAALLAKTNF